MLKVTHVVRNTSRTTSSSFCRPITYANSKTQYRFLVTFSDDPDFVAFARATEKTVIAYYANTDTVKRHESMLKRRIKILRKAKPNCEGKVIIIPLNQYASTFNFAFLDELYSDIFCARVTPILIHQGVINKSEQMGTVMPSSEYMKYVTKRKGVYHLQSIVFDSGQFATTADILEYIRIAKVTFLR